MELSALRDVRLRLRDLLKRSLTALFALALAVAGGRPADAAPAIHLELGGGGATLTAPNDADGEPTFLFGSSFTGPQLHGAIAVDSHVVGPLSIGGELGLGRYSMTGFAETTDARREVRLSWTALHVLARVRGELPQGVVRPYGGVVFGARVGVAASARDTRNGVGANDGPPSITTTTGFVAGLDAGVRLVFGNVSVPIGLRALNNLSTGTTTRDRHDGYRSLAAPGDLRVEATWTYGATVGIGWQL